MGLRVSTGGKTLAYLPDHEPQLGRRTLPRAEWLSGFSVAEGADLLIHDAQYTPDEYAERGGWGHCTPELAVRFAETSDAKKLLYFHHDPQRGDDELEKICADASATHDGSIEMNPAAESESYTI